jgi:type IV secretion system protein VirD4
MMIYTMPIKLGLRTVVALMPLILRAWPLAVVVATRWIAWEGTMFIARSHPQLADIAGRAVPAVATLAPAVFLIPAFFGLRVGGRSIMTMAGLALGMSGAVGLAVEIYRLEMIRQVAVGRHIAELSTWWGVLPWTDPIAIAAVAIAMLAGSIPFGCFGLFKNDQPQRAKVAVHGSADWLGISQLRALLGAPAGVVIGEAYRADLDKTAGPRFEPKNPFTWGQGGKAPLLIFDGETGSGHGMLIAGAGGYKTQSLGVPTALLWPSSLVYLDPSCEVGAMVRADRERQGRKVIFLDPTTGAGIDVLSWIKPKSPNAMLDIAAVAAWLMGERASKGGASAGDYFHQSAVGLVETLIADAVMSPDKAPHLRTLRGVRQILAQPVRELQAHLGDIVETHSVAYVRERASAFVGMADEQWSGVAGTAQTATQWLSAPSLAGLVSTPSFDLRELAGGNVDVFVQVPLRTLMATPAVARVIVGALLNAVYEAEAPAPRKRVLFLLDEAFQLGPMKILEQARDTGRKYGINLVLLYQSVGQIVDQWGEQGKRAWYDSATWRAYACVDDTATAAEIEKTCGSYTVLQESESQNQGTSRRGVEVMGSISGGTGVSLTPTKKDLISASSVRLLREDDQIVIYRGQPPIHCGRAIAFRRPDLNSRLTPSKYAA